MAKVDLTVSAECESPADPWLARLADRLRADQAQSVLCIVPTGDAAARLERRLLLDFGVPGLFGGPIRTFYRLARGIAQATRLGGHDLSDLQRSLLLQDIAADVNVPTLAHVQRFPGFAAALGDLIGEVKLAMIHPEELRRAMVNLPKSEAELAAKLRDILTLYERYQTTLEQQNLHDAEGLMWHAVSALENGQARLPGRVFFVHGFRSFNQVQLRLLRVIAQAADEVFIKVHHDETRPEAFAASERAIAALHEHVRAQPAVPLPDIVPAAQTDIAHITANIFRGEVTPKASDGSVIILESGSPAQEADQVAREIRRMVGDAGACAEGASRESLSYSDIAIITRGDEVRQRFAHVLARRGVPISRPTAALGESAVGRCLRSCLRIVRDGWPVSVVGAALKSPCLGDEAATLARAEVNAWQQGVSEGRDIWFAPWRDDDTLEARRQALAPVQEFEDRLRGAKTVRDMAGAARELLSGLARPDPSDLPARRDDDLARQRLDALIGELEAVARLSGEPASWEAFCDDLERAIAQAKYRPGARAFDGVALLDAQRLGGEAYRVVVAVNLLEKVFPAQVRENPFLRDRERRVLAAVDKDVKLDLAADLQTEERPLFWRTVSCATERLYLSYPTADAAAKEVLPSFYADEVKRLFVPGSLTVRSRRFSDLASSPDDAISADDWAACIFHGLSRDLDQPEQARYAAHYNAWLGAPEVEPGVYLSPAPDYPDVLHDPALLAALRDRDRPYHPSELERYVRCPYGYYCERLLELYAVEREIAPVDYGTLVHEVLARLYRDWYRDMGKPVDVTARKPDDVVARALSLLDECLARQPRFANLPPAQRAIERQRLADILTRFVPADLEQTARRGLRPAFFELQFGFPPGRSADKASRPEPLDLGELEGHRMLIVGRMDRVDLTPEGAAVIIDYKLGKGRYDLRGLDKGVMLQIPLYAMAVREIFGLEVAGAEYASVMGRDRTGVYCDRGLAAKRSAYNLIVSPAELVSRLATAAEQARVCIQRIRGGTMARGPLDECPTNCAYEGICRVDAWTLRQIMRARQRAQAAAADPKGKAADAG